MAVAEGEAAWVTARCGVARCGASRCGCAPNDIITDENGATGVIDHIEPATDFSTYEGTVLGWGVSGAGGGVDPLPEG